MPLITSPVQGSSQSYLHHASLSPLYAPAWCHPISYHSAPPYTQCLQPPSACIILPEYCPCLSPVLLQPQRTFSTQKTLILNPTYTFTSYSQQYTLLPWHSYSLLLISPCPPPPHTHTYTFYMLSLHYVPTYQCTPLLFSLWTHHFILNLMKWITFTYISLYWGVELFAPCIWYWLILRCKHWNGKSCLVSEQPFISWTNYSNRIVTVTFWNASNVMKYSHKWDATIYSWVI